MAYADLPRIRLLEHPTPLQRMARIGAELGHPFLFVKRDDVMALGLGGNKVRSLEFWIGEALDQDCDTLVVAGAPASNQCRLTAAAAAKLGLRCMIVHNDNPPEHLEGNLLLSHLFGAEISYIGPVDEDIRHEVVKEKAEERRKAGAKPYIIGDEVLGAAGYVVAALELLDQAAQIDVAFDHFVIPGSMGPTEAGFLYGLLSGGFRGQVHVISVEYGVEEMAARIEAIFARLEARIGVLNVAPSTIARYDDTFLGDGYGKMSPAAADAIKRFGTTEALLLETTYTAKPFAALLAMIERGSIGAHEPVCALHTGGLPSLFDTSTLRRFSDAKIFTNSP
jgi:1-aminocyclopropane-1-carboxylate deaminase/D-cysteine desulfhydrase-like pyridoxal-dependent ACC family enzyme